MMRITRTLAVLILTAAPAFAEGEDTTPEKGFSLIEEGARIILRSMMDEMEPALKDLHQEFGQALDEMGPALGQLAEMIGDIRNYNAPEMLPNGDIIIRRKTPEELALPAPGGEIDL